MRFAHPTVTSPARPAAGFTLLEVLVALAVLSVGLLGLAALQITSLQLNTNSYFRTQATVAVYDLVDRMRSNPIGFRADEYHVPNTNDATNKVKAYAACEGSDCNCDAVACDPAKLALYDVGEWLMALYALLPQSEAIINRDPATNEVTIRIEWVEKDMRQGKSWTVRL